MKNKLSEVFGALLTLNQGPDRAIGEEEQHDRGSADIFTEKVGEGGELGSNQAPGGGGGGQDPASPLVGDYGEVAKGDLVIAGMAIRLSQVRIREIALGLSMFSPLANSFQIVITHVTGITLVLAFLELGY